MRARQFLLVVLVLLPMVTVLAGAYEIHRLLDDAAAAKIDLATDKMVAGLLRSALSACARPPEHSRPPASKSL
jgi:hypothetical protein